MSNFPAISPAILPAILSPRDAIPGQLFDVIPRSGLVMYMRNGVDTIGLSSGPPQPGRGLLGNGSARIQVAGLAWNDTIASDSTDQALILGGAFIDITNGDFVYGLTIRRAGAIIAYYSCGEDSGTTVYNLMPDVPNALPDGELTSAAIRSNGVGGAGYDNNILGFSKRENLKIWSEDLTHVPMYLNNASGNAERTVDTLSVECAGIDEDRVFVNSTDPDMYLSSGTRYAFGIEMEDVTTDAFIRVTLLQSGFGASQDWCFLSKPGEIQYHNFTPSVSGFASLSIGAIPIANTPQCTAKISKIHIVEDVTPTDYGKIVMIGDSLTSSGTAAGVAKILTGTTVVDQGTSGDTTTQMLARFAADVVAETPDHVVIWGGINDISFFDLDDGNEVTIVMSNITAMCDLADAANISVSLVNLTAFGTCTEWTATRQGYHDAINAGIEALATARGYGFVDMHSISRADGTNNMKNLLAHSRDGLHPNDYGYMVYAQTICEQAFPRAYPTNYRATTATPITGIKPVLLDGSADALDDPVQFPGPLKLSVQGDPGAYFWGSAPRLQLRTGVNNVVYDAAGAGKTFATKALALAAMATLADDTYLFAGTKAAALYSVDMSAKAEKIKKIVGD